jgi:hypothetical protein
MRKHSLILLAILALFAPVVAGQVTGTITLSGTVPTACSMTDTSNNSLSSTMSLGALSAAANNTLTTATVSARLRSNKAYVLSVQASALTFGGLAATGGGNTLTAGDIAFGVTGITRSGANVAAGSDTIVTGPPSFDYRGGYPAVSNGLTPFVAGTNGTLNDLAANTQIQSGTRISVKGNNISNNNYLTESLGIALLAQYFTPNTSFSTTVTVTMTCP